MASKRRYTAKKIYQCHVALRMHKHPCRCGRRRRPTDSERLDALLRLLRKIRPDLELTRRDIDKLMREEAKK